MIETWDAWGKMFTAIPVWEPAVREICRRIDLPIRTIEAGYPGTNAVFVLDQTYVIKIYAPFCHEDFELECTLYPLLAEDARIPAPQLLAEGVFEERIEWPYIIMNFIPGQPVREVYAHLAPTDKTTVARELGEITRALHATPLTRVEGLDTSRATWQAFIERQRASVVLANLREGTLPEPLVRALPNFLDAVPLHADEAPLRLVNGDLTEDHVLLVQREGGWHISGLIDFADALIGQREYEWPALWFGALQRDPASLRAFMHAYDPNLTLDRMFFERAMVFTLLHEFGPGIITWAFKQMGFPPVASVEDLRETLWRT